MDRESVLGKFKTLNLWGRGETRAPHKPLLVILTIGELLRGKGRLLPYSEIDTKLGELLSEYGPGGRIRGRGTRSGGSRPMGSGRFLMPRRFA